MDPEGRIRTNGLKWQRRRFKLRQEEEHLNCKSCPALEQSASCSFLSLEVYKQRLNDHLSEML